MSNLPIRRVVLYKHGAVLGSHGPDFLNGLSRRNRWSVMFAVKNSFSSSCALGPMAMILDFPRHVPLSLASCDSGESYSFR